MGTGGAPEAPAAPGGLDAAGQAARDRLSQAFPEPLAPGTPADVAADALAPPAAGEPDFDIFADGAVEGLNLDGLQYRDGKKLEGEIRAARDRFKPFNDAFGSMDEEQRTALLAAAPELGSDLAAFSAVAPHLHPDDRAYFMEAMSLFASDPLKASEMLAAGADILRQQFTQPGATPPAPASAPPDASWVDPDGAAPTDPAEQPLTRADLEAWSAQQEYARTVADQERQILAQARDLGYDPDSSDPVADARFRTLLSMAGRPDVGGDLTKAHQFMEQMDQAAIDRFVQGKAADADRPGAPVTGAAPVQVPVLANTADAREAMLARLDGTLGPDPRRRGAED